MIQNIKLQTEKENKTLSTCVYMCMIEINNRIINFTEEKINESYGLPRIDQILGYPFVTFSEL